MSVDVVMSLAGVFMALGFFGLMTVIFGRAVTKAQEKYREMEHQLEVMTSKLDQFDREMEQIKADNDSRRVRIEQIVEETDQLREQTTNILAKAHHVYYILNDRWTVADEEWIVPVRNLAMFGRTFHRQVVESWSEGRSFIVWAPKSDIALRQMENRYPQTGGFLIGAPIPSPLKLAPRWTYKAESMGSGKGGEAPPRPVKTP